jgi:hypothetical protein
MKQRIQAAGADAVSVRVQLLDHPQAENRLFGRMVQHMQLDQPGVQVTVGDWAFPALFSFSPFDNDFMNGKSRLGRRVK